MLRLRMTVLLCATILTVAYSRSAAEDRNVFFGLMHSHTGLSDGEGTPEAAYDSARDAGLDFFAITEHNHSQAAGSDGVFLTPENYHTLIETADEKTVNGEFVAIYGQEVSTISRGNHANVFFAPEIVNMPNGDFRFLYEVWIPDHPDASLIQLNHPKGGQSATTRDYGIDDYDGNFADLLNACDRYVALIEVIKGEIDAASDEDRHVDARYEDEYFFYLNKGFHVAPSVGGDEHQETWGKTMKARLGVWATELSRGGLEEAIHGRHCYATEDGDVEVQLSVDGKIMGSAVELSGTQDVDVTVSFDDPDEPDAQYRVQLFYDDAIGGEKAKQVENELVNSTIDSRTFTRSVVPGSYLFAKVVQISSEGGQTHADDTWTAPLWFVEMGAPLLAGTGSSPTSPMPVAPDAVIDWSDAADHIGQTVTVEGKIVRVHNHENRILFMNFAPNFQETLSLVVFADNFEDFDPIEGVDALDERLLDKKVSVKGRITTFRNTQLQMVIRSPDQILSVEGE